MKHKNKFTRFILKQDKIDCTVVVLAYNAENYIAECLSSIEKQETNYKINVLVHDDCSTDKTVQVVNRFAGKSKFSYRVITESKNQFKTRGFDFAYRLYEGCESKYIALLNADDVWTAPDKLETQIVLLEENPEVAITSHCFSTFSDSTTHKSITWPNPEFREPISTYADLSKENFIGTLTVVFRRSFLPTGLVGFHRLGMGDYPLWGLLASRGTIRFIDRDMAGYRIHSNQYYYSKPNLEKYRLLLECKMFIANHTEGLERQTWIKSIENDIVQNYLNANLLEKQ